MGLVGSRQRAVGNTHTGVSLSYTEEKGYTEYTGVSLSYTEKEAHGERGTQRKSSTEEEFHRDKKGFYFALPWLATPCMAFFTASPSPRK